MSATDASAPPAEMAGRFRQEYIARVGRALSQYVEQGRDVRLETIRPEGPDAHRANIVFSVDADTFNQLLGQLEAQERSES